MRRMSFVMMALLLVLTGPALAGRNSGGSLIVHTDDAINYSAGTDYCGTAMPAECGLLGTQTNKADPDASIVWFVAAFHADADPEVAAVRLGLRTNLSPFAFDAWSVCGEGALEIPTGDWPDADDGLSGNAIAWPSPTHSHLFSYYWFAVFGSGNTGDYVGTTVDPRVGFAGFADLSNPPDQDRTLRFGTVMWNEPGWNTCPILPVPGACCTPANTCVVLMEGDCNELNGFYAGENTTCDPSTCGACCYTLIAGPYCAYTTWEYCNYFPDGVWLGAGVACDPGRCRDPEACCLADGRCVDLPAGHCVQLGGVPEGPGTSCATFDCQLPPTGACCFDQACQVTTEEYCLSHGGRYMGDNRPCDPNPCLVPIEHTTWGQIKAGYR